MSGHKPYLLRRWSEYNDFWKEPITISCVRIWNIEAVTRIQKLLLDDGLVVSLKDCQKIYEHIEYNENDSDEDVWDNINHNIELKY